MAELRVSLEENEWNHILSMLLTKDMPWVVSNPLIFKIRTQIEAQQQSGNRQQAAVPGSTDGRQVSREVPAAVPENWGKAP